METLADIALVFAFLGFAAFCVLYFLRSKWQDTPVGRNAMALMAACALLLGLAVIRLFAGPDWFDRHRDLLRFASYALIGSIVWWRVALLIKLQRRPRKGRPGAR
jgi:multisubunit Na+/H+ antiporter MnhF subunit